MNAPADISDFGSLAAGCDVPSVLEGFSFATDFRHWVGASGRKYLTRAFSLDTAREFPGAPVILACVDEDDRRVVVGWIRYEGYVARQEKERARVRRLRHVSIPSDFSLATIPGLSLEIIEGLERERPTSLAEAERVPGMTPAALAILAGRLAGAKGGG